MNTRQVKQEMDRRIDLAKREIASSGMAHTSYYQSTIAQLNQIVAQCNFATAMGIPGFKRRGKVAQRLIAPLEQLRTESTRYNGWTNYETWCVALWLDNEIAHNLRADSTDAQELAAKLREEIEQNAPDWLTGVVGVYADLLGAALSEVRWSKIAQSVWQE